MTVGAVLAWVFGAIAAVEGVALVLSATALRRTREQLCELERSLRIVPRTGKVDRAGRVVRSVVQQAARLREQGVSQALSSSLEDLVQWAKADRERIVRVADEHGAVTVLFSDIADSTSLNEALGDTEWVRVLADHDRLVRGEIERRDGVVVKSIGDGFMAVFGGAQPAVRAALAIHDRLRSGSSRRLRRTRLGVRIGIHTGTAISSGEDYLGRNVALCARIASHARAGETLISVDTRNAVGEGTGLSFRPEGKTAFKGISDEIDIFAVEHPTA